MAIIADTRRVVVNGTNGQGEVWSNAFHIKPAVPTPLTQSEANDITNAVMFAYNELEPVWHSACAVTEVVVSDVSQEPAPSFIGQPINPFPVGEGGAPLPFQCAIVVSWTTILNSRRGRGRTFIAGIAEGNLNAFGRLASGSQAIIVEWAREMVENLDGEGYALAIASPTDGVSRPVTGGRVGDVFDTQNRRRDDLVEVFVTVPFP